MFAYTYNNPGNWIDPMGLIVHFEGNAEEIALMQNWMDKLEKCAKCDDELSYRLSEVKNCLYHFYIGFKEGFNAGGFNSQTE